MTGPFGDPVVIADLRAGGGRVAAAIPDLERLLPERGFEHRLLRTTTSADTSNAAREAVLGGHRFLVAVGDDGTVNDVVNGLFDETGPVGTGVVLGVVAAGTECDFIRTFGLPSETARAVEHLTGSGTFAIDVGKVTCVGPEGAPRTRYYPNVGQVGLFAAARAREQRLPGWLGRGRYFAAFWLTVAGFRRTRATVRTNGRTYQETIRDVVVANGQYHGRGLHISPRSWPGDGLLDVLLMTGPRSEAFTLLPKVFRGEHLPHPHIIEFKAKTVRVEADRPLWVEVDGLVVGKTPATFEVVSKPLSLKI